MLRERRNFVNFPVEVGALLAYFRDMSFRDTRFAPD
jgi:hypothetical protein